MQVHLAAGAGAGVSVLALLGAARPTALADPATAEVSGLWHRETVHENHDSIVL